MPRDASEYDERFELAEYLWHNYFTLFTDLERMAAKTLWAEQKVAECDSDALGRMLLQRFSSRGRDEVDRLLEVGPVEFRLRAAERVLQDHAHVIHLNRCSKCGRVVATPTAQQCLWCGYDWH